MVYQIYAPRLPRYGHSVVQYQRMSSSEIKFDSEFLQARWVLGSIAAEEFVAQALIALEAGRDCPALRQIAGLDKPTTGDLGTLPARALTELGLQRIDRLQAASVVVDRHMASTSPAISEFVRSFPEFGPQWNKHVVAWGGDPAAFYIDMAEFVHFVVEDLYQTGAVAETQRAFDMLERLLTEGDEAAKDLVALGFFETLQCFTSWRPYGQTAFEKFLGTNSRDVWNDLHIIWRGKSSLAAVIRAENKTK
jgi:hypothetical protein